MDGKCQQELRPLSSLQWPLPVAPEKPMDQTVVSRNNLTELSARIHSQESNSPACTCTTHMCRQHRFSWRPSPVSYMISFGRVTCTFASGLHLIWKSRHRSCTILLGNFSSLESQSCSTQFVQWMDSVIDWWITACSGVPGLGGAACGHARFPVVLHAHTSQATIGGQLLTHRESLLLTSWLPA